MNTDRTVSTGAGESAETRVGALRRELGLRDLVLMQFLCVISTTWLGVAGRLGASHAILWLVAMSLFYAPLALVVIHLQRRTPLEGGLYQWTKQAFGSSAAFMVSWNIWLFSVLNTGLVGLLVATYFSYAFGPKAAWMVESPWFSAAASAAVIAMLAGLAVRGLSASKWMHNASGVALALTFVALLGLPIAHLVRGSLRGFPLIPTEAPAVSLSSVSAVGKLGFGALCGFESAAIVSGECHDPRRAVGRSVLIAAVGVAIAYVFGTAAVLSFVRPEEIDLEIPIPQVLSVGLPPLGGLGYLVPVVVIVLLGCSLGGGSINFTTTSRLPMVAGWDRVLPAWFGRLHPRWGTPVNAILVTALVMLAFAGGSLLGVRHDEAYQLLLNASLVCYALTYLVMFAIPLRRAHHDQGRSAPWLKVAAVSGFVMTLLYIVTAGVPLVKVQSAVGFSGRILGVALLGNLVGVALLLLARRRGTSVELRAER